MPTEIDAATLEQRFEAVLEEAILLRKAEMEHGGGGKDKEDGGPSPLTWWRDLKPKLDEEFGTAPLQGLRWAQTPVYPKTELDDDFHADGSVDQHFLNQLVRIPRDEPAPTVRKVLQLALNAGQGLAHGTVAKRWKMGDFVEAA